MGGYKISFRAPRVHGIINKMLEMLRDARIIPDVWFLGQRAAEARFLVVSIANVIELNLKNGFLAKLPYVGKTN